MATVEQLLLKASELGWSVTPPFSDEMGDIEFAKYSPAGYDFNFALNNKETAEELVNELERNIDAYDPLYEAHLWVGADGHGRKGAPDDPRDIIADMEACKEMMEELLEEWMKLV